MSVILLILGLLLFVMLVVVHEFGHFLAARRNGVEVEEFGIGFPPRAWGKKTKKGFLFSLNWLPIGGFVKLKGEHDSDTAPHSFGAASLITKVKIMVAGVSMNLLTAFVLFTVLAAVGMPKLIDNQFTVKNDTQITKNQVLVASIENKSPAQTAKMQTKDEIIAISGENHQTISITSQEELHKTTKLLAGQKVEIQVMRGSEAITLQANLRGTQEVEASLKTSNPKGHLGIAPVEYTVQRSTWSAPVVAVGTIGQLTVLTLKGLGHAIQGLGSIFAGLFTGNQTARRAGQAQASQDVSGPVGIFFILKQSSQLGIVFILFIVAYISLALAIMNLLPIPALDGGRLYLTLAFHAARKPLKKSTEELINGVGFLILMILIVLITIVDVKRFF